MYHLLPNRLKQNKDANSEKKLTVMISNCEFNSG